MDSPKHVLDGYEIARALKSLPSWRRRGGALVCAWSFATSREAVDFLAIVAEAAEHLGHHPDVDWRWNTIFLTSTSHDVGGEITPRDIELATLLEFAAADSGAIAVPHRHQDMTLAIDAQDPGKLEGFWSATLGYRKGRDGDLVDPERRNPPLWFQETQTPNANRFHIDKLVARSEFDAAREKMLPAAGEGDAIHAPRWVIYTDPDGNRMCLCAEPEVPGETFDA
ncbi:4a-hydroxytetrahydrobiopterin dehydratase [Paeniglutamicibacter kerguelensis]|uniref:Putative pterin-4-alpha-carbinolamine dehydratase n=1 Tax=Paeniglutamicibacter kerguelensis TaxID=254788 RepID=A0ABS4XE46_9MICC|nr:4a-hydroxytetrahydrobiopterin dehydratase [Paeniglutamicibacter kerguelensis]MBP2386743.1 4a-hydroxytetrahydrobiopterin dehydratase [Paeniglutamicibacter kerguelensis]